MPFSTGTADTAAELVQAINALGVANGWTKLAGEPDNACASPKAARYWRFLWIDELTFESTRRLGSLQFRSTLGGSAVTGTWNQGNMAGAPGPFTISWGSGNEAGWFYLDCGTPTTVRECAITSGADGGEAPADFYIQWSNDAVTWTTMYRAVDIVWGNNETKVFQFDDGYLDQNHPSGTDPRRNGADLRDTSPMTYLSNDSFSEYSNDLWVWQLPGYDANRREYIYCRAHSNDSDSTCYLEFYVGPTYNSAILRCSNQEGISPRVVHIFDINPISYWIYLNGTRLIVVTKSGPDDYASSYIGFMAAFADPTNYPMPIYAGSSSSDFDDINNSSKDYSSAMDPGEGHARVRLWDNIWYSVDNIPTGQNRYSYGPLYFTFPYCIVGNIGSEVWPVSFISNGSDPDGHWLNHHEPTAQGELPIYPVIVCGRTQGNIGALQGVFCIPGSTIVPEQVITINAQNYRAFPARKRRDGSDWFLVRED